MISVLGLLLFLLVHAADQITDVLTSLIYFAQGLVLEGCGTLSLVFLPGLVVFCVEARQAFLGRGNIFRGLCLMLVCPAYTWVVILYSLHNTEWRDKAMLLVVVEGFLSASPQLILQLSLAFKGVLTEPTISVLADLPSFQPNVTAASAAAAAAIVDDNPSFQFLGRSYDSQSSSVFGIIQLASLVISCTSVLASGIYFNDLETGVHLRSSHCRKFVGAPLFLATILHRALAISLVICFLEWWSSLIVFGLFFVTVLMSVCAGDLFGRACAYGVWSQLLPVGFARDPLESLGYKTYSKYSIAETNESLSSNSFLKKRANYFINSHLIISAVVLLPSVIIATVLVNQAAVYTWLDINTRFIFHLSTLNTVILPGIGVLLAVSVLLGRLYLTLVYRDFKRITM